LAGFWVAGVKITAVLPHTLVPEGVKAGETGVPMRTDPEAVVVQPPVVVAVSEIV
jgi:hypothetical protein